MHGSVVSTGMRECRDRDDLLPNGCIEIKTENYTTQEWFHALSETVHVRLTCKYNYITQSPIIMLTTDFASWKQFQQYCFVQQSGMHQCTTWTGTGKLACSSETSESTYTVQSCLPCSQVEVHLVSEYHHLFSIRANPLFQCTCNRRVQCSQLLHLCLRDPHQSLFHYWYGCSNAYVWRWKKHRNPNIQGVGIACWRVGKSSSKKYSKFSNPIAMDIFSMYKCKGVCQGNTWRWMLCCSKFTVLEVLFFVCALVLSIHKCLSILWYQGS